jgi:hypothetical protein
LFVLFRFVLSGPSDYSFGIFKYFLKSRVDNGDNRILKQNIFLREICKNNVIWGVVFNAIFKHASVISRRSVLLVGEIGVPGENHRPAASY